MNISCRFTSNRLSFLLICRRAPAVGRLRGPETPALPFLTIADYAAVHHSVIGPSLLQLPLLGTNCLNMSRPHPVCFPTTPQDSRLFSSGFPSQIHFFTAAFVVCIHRRTGQFFLVRAEPSLAENFFDGARKTAMLTCKITLPDSPHPVIIRKKIPDFRHFVLLDGANSFFSFNKYNIFHF